MFSLFKKPGEEIVAVFDIGNGSIGGALVRLSTHLPPVIIYSHREPLSYVESPTSRHLLSHMLKNLKIVAHDLALNGLKSARTSPFLKLPFHDIFCVFASPWYISQTKMLKLENDKEFTVTKKIISNIVGEEQKRLSESIKDGKHAFLSNDAIPLEKRIINTSLNGYDIDKPIGKKAREVELTLFSSFISKDVITKTAEVIQSALHGRTIKSSSYAISSWNAVQKMFPNEHDYLFADVSGETTEFSLVINDIPVEVASFPIGRNAVLRKTVRDLKVAPSVAESYLSMESSGTLEKGQSGRLNEAIKPLQDEWFRSLNEIVLSWGKNYIVPNSIFVTVDSDVSMIFETVLKRNMPAELGIIKNLLDVKILGSEKVQSYVEYLPNVKRDPFVAIESLFLNGFFSGIGL